MLSSRKPRTEARLRESSDESSRAIENVPFPAAIGLAEPRKPVILQRYRNPRRGARAYSSRFFLGPARATELVTRTVQERMERGDSIASNILDRLEAPLPPPSTIYSRGKPCAWAPRAGPWVAKSDPAAPAVPPS